MRAHTWITGDGTVYTPSEPDDSLLSVIVSPGEGRYLWSIEWGGAPRLGDAQALSIAIQDLENARRQILRGVR